MSTVSEEVLDEVHCLICEDEEASVVEVALQTLPNTIVECSKKNCYEEICPVLREVLSLESLSRLPESSRILAPVFDRICTAIFANIAMFHELLPLIIDIYIQLARSSCSITASSSIQATKIVHKIHSYCNESGISLVDGISTQLTETVESFFRRDDVQIQKQAALHFVAISHVLPRKTAQRLYVE